jgi:hypothetical protein
MSAWVHASGHQASLTGGPSPVSNFQKIIQTDFKCLFSKIENSTFAASKNYGKIRTYRFDEEDQLCQLVKLAIQNRF